MHLCTSVHPYSIGYQILYGAHGMKLDSRLELWRTGVGFVQNNGSKRTEMDQPVKWNFLQNAIAAEGKQAVLLQL